MTTDPSRTSTDPHSYCREILPHVSRTFALTIPFLREPLQGRVGTAYLLCRIADTVEDRPGLEPEHRAELFALLTRLVQEPRDPAGRGRFQATWPPLDDPYHESLVRHAGDVLDLYAAFPEPARRATSECLDEMIAGMIVHPGPVPGAVPVEACADLPALERYCHAVAGTVGILLSRLFAEELPGTGWLTPERAEQGRRFGLGLQLTNVLKDHEGDGSRGIRYLPRSWMRREGGRARLTGRGLDTVVRRAVEHLDAAHEYVLSLPRERSDMRLFCVVAAHLALATLHLAVTGEADGRPAKVSRESLAGILGRAERHAEDDRGLEHLHRGYRDAVLAALAAATTKPPVRERRSGGPDPDQERVPRSG